MRAKVNSEIAIWEKGRPHMLWSKYTWVVSTKQRRADQLFLKVVANLSLCPVTSHSALLLFLIGPSGLFQGGTLLTCLNISKATIKRPKLVTDVSVPLKMNGLWIQSCHSCPPPTCPCAAHLCLVSNKFGNSALWGKVLPSSWILKVHLYTLKLKPQDH